MGLFTEAFLTLTGGTSRPAHSNQLATGARPEQYRGGRAENLMRTSGQLADTVGRREVLNMERVAGAQEKQLLHLGRQAQTMLKIRDYALEEMQIRTDYSKNAMKQEEKFQRLKASHAKAAYRYELGSEATQQNLSAYEAATNIASTVIQF